jgi:ABC-type multidrug transport system fused ATPase/permease subunit
VVAVLTVLLVVFAVVLRDKINPSLLGLSLVSMMNLGFSMKGIIMYWSILETSLGAIARIREFSEGTPTERLLPEESTTPPTAWPARGDLDIRNMSVQYE